MQLGYQRCQRLITAKMLPGRDGQPVHVQVHVDLATLRGLPAAPGGPGCARPPSVCHGPSSWTMSAPAASRSATSSWTASGPVR